VQIRLDLRNGADIGSIAWEYPGPHRHAIASDGHGNDHLRLIVPAFLAVTPPAQRGEQAKKR